ATLTSTAGRMTMGTKAYGRSPVSGRRSSIHPNGLAQRSQANAGSESATIRTRYAPAITPARITLASWRVAASCDTTMPTAMNIAADATSAVAQNTAAPTPMFTLDDDPPKIVSTAVGN